jgi:hypothetical protein
VVINGNFTKYEVLLILRLHLNILWMGIRKTTEASIKIIGSRINTGNFGMSDRTCVTKLTIPFSERKKNISCLSTNYESHRLSGEVRDRWFNEVLNNKQPFSQQPATRHYSDPASSSLHPLSLR